MYTFTGSGTKENVIQTGHIVITFNDVNNISIQNRYPETDSEGLANTDTNSQMTFTVTSDITGSTKVNYALGITDIQEGATLTQDYIKIYLKKGNSVATGFTENKGELISSFKPLYIENVMTSHVLLTDVISGSEVHTYTLKAWIDENYKLPIIARSEKYEVVSVSACATFFANAASVSTDVATSFCNGTGSIEGQTLEYLDTVEDSNEMLQYMLTNNIIKKRTNIEHTTSTDSETFTFKIKGYGTTESIEVKRPTIKQFILGENNSNVILSSPILTSTYDDAKDASGVYMSTQTNDNTPTYYYRGMVEDNYVVFANFLWRVVRINEDGTIRIILQDGINNNTNYSFNSTTGNYKYMYFSESSSLIDTLNEWYNNNLKQYEKNIVTTTFCESYKVTSTNPGFFSVGKEKLTTFDKYTTNFKCNTDANGKGVISAKIGLLSYDEAVHAGMYPSKSSSPYINISGSYWLMAPLAYSGSGYGNYALVWYINNGNLSSSATMGEALIRPVISLASNIDFTGSGTETDPYIIK